MNTSTQIKLQKLGVGGFAGVYLDDTQKCILKINKKKTDKLDKIKTLQHEISIYKFLDKYQSQHILQYFDSLDNDQYVMIKLAKCDSDLCRLLNYIPTNSYDIYIQITVLILKGLEFLHSKNVIHCDIKASNILVQFQGNGKLQLLLCDFGLAQFYETDNSILKGTDQYIDPNMVWYQRATFGSDLWAVGVLLLSILFRDEQLQFLTVENYKKMKLMKNFEMILQSNIDNILQKCENPRLQSIIKMCLQIKQETRYTARDILAKIAENGISQGGALDIGIQVPDKQQLDLSSIPHICYFKIDSKFRVYTIQQCIVFEDNNQQYSRVVCDLKKGLFYNDTHFLKTHISEIKKYITEMGFNNKFKTNSFSFWYIGKVVEIIDGVHVGVLQQTIEKCPETYIFVLKVSKGSSFMVQVYESKIQPILYINKMGSLMAISLPTSLKHKELSKILTIIEEFNDMLNDQ